MISAILNRISRVVSWPAMILHELTHMMLALPWSVESAIIIDDRGPAHYVTWQPDTPRWAVALASLGPTIFGSVIGLVGLWRLYLAPPGGPSELLLSGAIAAYWTIYVAPSPDDLNIADPSSKQTNTED